MADGCGEHGPLLQVFNELIAHRSSRAKKADSFFDYLNIASQLPVLSFQLSDALVLCRERFADAALALLLCINLTEPAPDGAFAKVHIFADLTDTQALGFDHLHHLELEVRVKSSSGFLLVHSHCHLGLKKSIVVSF